MSDEADFSLKDEPDDSGVRLKESTPHTLTADWPAAARASITNIRELSRHLVLTVREERMLEQVIGVYQMKIPRYYLSLIDDPFNPQDCIRRQCIPSLEEIADGTNEHIDPLGEVKTSPLPYLVHRYPDRVLFLVTNQCFMYCRHCTRKRLWKKQGIFIGSSDIEEAACYIRNHKNIREVIISGGDPLTLATEKIDRILSALSGLDNIEVIRIGTRAPVVFPQRVDSALCRVLRKYRNLWINLQFNHPREVTPESTLACRKLQECTIPLSNQAVLLKGINDTSEVMVELCRKLQNIRVRPYYLFECDPVVGTRHFRTPVLKGIEIIKSMRGYTGGMCVPTFVVDGIDGKGKVPLGPDYLVSSTAEGVFLRNYKDELFFYADPQQVLPPGSAPGQKSSVQTIGIIFNLKKNKGDSDAEEEYDELETIESLSSEIERCGFKVKLFEQDNTLSDSLCRLRPDFVLNLAEGVGNSRSRESQVPALLESLGIPYSGSDPVALGITLDKYLTGRLLAAAGIPVPVAFILEHPEETDRLKDIFEKGAVFIIKPRWEGSSKGIFLNSVVDNFRDLQIRVCEVISRYSQPALVEEFLEKDEITVGVGGNSSPRLLGMMKIVPRDKNQKRFLYSLETKRDWEAKVKYLSEESIPLTVKASITHYSLTAYRILELRDFVRIDFRLSRDNSVKIIDVNPLPGLSPRYSDLPILYRLQGKTYSELIGEFLKDSFARNGLPWQ